MTDQPGLVPEQTLAELADGLRANGELVSAGPIAGFAGGWALMVSVETGEHSHHWTRVEPDVGIRIDAERVTAWRAACGLIAWTHSAAPPLGEENYPRCLHCMRRTACST